MERNLFSCIKCDNCCSKDHEGCVIVFPEDVDQIAKGIGMEITEILNNFCDRAEYEYNVPDENLNRSNMDKNIPVYILKEKNNSACIFFDELRNLCKIYPYRPNQCQRFPYIECVLRNKEVREEIFEICPVFESSLRKIKKRYMKRKKGEELRNSETILHGLLPKELISSLIKQERKEEYQYYRSLKNNDMECDNIYINDD